MASSTAETFVVIGSGPGIGVSTASLFALKKFNKVALISRDKKRLEQDRETVLSFLSSRTDKKVEVKTWSTDVIDLDSYKKVLEEVEQFGEITCVVFNPARVGPSELFTFDQNEIVKDFMTTNIALYTTATWAIPILSKAPTSSSPSLLVTSSLLWKEPYPPFFALSLVKASQRNLVQTLAATYPDIHLALLNVGGIVSKEDKYLNPDAIAEHYWDLYAQKKEEWTFDLDVLPKMEENY